MRDWRKSNRYLQEGVEGLYREGEEYISENGWYSLLYARDVIKGRFLIGEEGMKESNIIWGTYVNFLKKKGIEI